jgi:hypothetical protein
MIAEGMNPQMIARVCDSTEDGMIRFKQPGIEIEEVTDATELAKAHEQDERFERNWTWFVAHAAEIYARHRGQCVCVAGQELFVADAPEAVLALARAAHPEDDGRFTRYIPREKAYRIYAHHRGVAPVR